MSDRISFTLPVAVVNKRAKTVGIGTAVAIALTPFFSGIDFFSSGHLWTTASIVCLFVICYLMLKNIVFVTLAADGISGRGVTRQVLFRWTDELLLEHNADSVWGGISLRRKGDNALRRETDYLFVPQAVYLQKSFMSAVRKYAPVNHPLHTAIKP